MKRYWKMPQPEPSDQQAWKGPGHLKDTPEFREWLDQEFPRGAAEMTQEETEVSRRSFLQLMGASTALAGFGMTGCRRPEHLIKAYTKSVEWVVPGKPLFYASTMPKVDGGTPLVVTTHEGRPTKVDGNPLHPDSVGGTDSFGQASILDLYDPDRTKDFRRKGKKVSREEWGESFSAIASELTEKQGAGAAFLVGHSTSPTRQRVIAQLKKKFPQSRWYRYEALLPENAWAATEEAFGAGARQLPHFDKADRVLSLDCDFLGLERTGTDAVGDFAKMRKPEKGDKVLPMNRLYVAESAFSLTGGMADHRFRINTSQVAKLAVLLAEEMGIETGAIVAPSDFGKKTSEWVKACVSDLRAHPGHSLVVVGSRQPKSVHLLAAEMNRLLGAYGKTLSIVKTQPETFGALAELKKDIDGGAVETLFLTTEGDPAYDAPADLQWAETQKKVPEVIQLGNRRNATAALATWNVPGVHYLEAWGDLRSGYGTYSLMQPMILPLYGGVSELELFLGLLAGEALAEATNTSLTEAYTAVRETFAAELTKVGDPPSSGDAWERSLRDGFLKGSAYALEAQAPAISNLPAQIQEDLKDRPTADALEVTFCTDYSVYDGRYVNNGWLQEAPDPISKLTWDNAALVSPATARALGLAEQLMPERAEQLPYSGTKGAANSAASPDTEGPLIELEIKGRKLQLPAVLAFGHSDHSITISLGYGHDLAHCGSVARGADGKSPNNEQGFGVGFNVYPLRDSQSQYFAQGAKVTSLGRTYPLALTQEHHSMFGRALVRERTLETYKKTYKLKGGEGYDDHGTGGAGGDGKKLKPIQLDGMDAHIPPNVNLYKSTDTQNQPLLNDDKHQWGMVVDLNSCVGCNACLLACQAENNIPIVGKEQVRRGREMHWVRMDRYFSIDKKNTFDPDNPEMLPQPVSCVQCEQAPCETVCPVNATVHSEDGLNLMAYNRCIGTRYCANNCPYKARRFNYFDYNKRPLDQLYRSPAFFPYSKEGRGETTLQLQNNPNVTVRMRGVMEKCTYCIQRLQAAKIERKQITREKTLALGQRSEEVAISVEDLRIPTGKLKVACQQVCPAECVIFGNLLDPADPIRKYKELDEDRSKAVHNKHNRNYDLLTYVNTRPRTSYLARIKNVNPSMPDAPYIGNASVSIH
ncbi:MAG: TAT-variant-translocated molybdopterin oxidoreductase [Verrucomicrobiota bacterium]